MAEVEKPEQEGKPKKQELEKKPEQAKPDKWASIIRAIEGPIGLYALVILAVISIATAINLSGLSEPHKYTLYCWLVTLLFSVAGIATILTILVPRNLNPAMAEALKQSQEALSGFKDIQHFLNSQAFKDAVIDVLEGDESPNKGTKTLRPGEQENE